MKSRVIVVISLFLTLFMACTIALTAVGLKINYDSNQNIQTLLINKKTATALAATQATQAAKATLLGQKNTLTLFAVLEEELGTIIIANHLTTAGEQVQCTANAAKFTVSCKVVKVPVVTTTTMPTKAKT